MYNFTDLYNILFYFVSFTLVYKIYEKPLPLKDNGKLDWVKYWVEAIPILLFHVSSIVINILSL